MVVNGIPRLSVDSLVAIAMDQGLSQTCVGLGSDESAPRMYPFRTMDG